MSFVHLHNHTHYSALDGAIKVDQMIDKALEYEMEAVAITDHGNMCGAVEFYQKALEKGVKPIIGQEFYVSPDDMRNRSYRKGENTNYHLVLLAENNVGYQNLLKLSSAGYIEGFYRKPRIDFELLKQHKEGLICSTACLAGEIPQKILNNNYDEALETAKIYKDLFGPDRFYLELQDHRMPEQKIVNEALIKISDELNIPIIATNDCHYLNREDSYAHEILLCIQTGKTMSDENRMRFDSDQFYFKSKDEMENLFADYPDAIFNTKKIADMCNVELELGNPVLPVFEVPDGHTSDSYFTELVYQGAAHRFGDPLSNEVKDRIEYELSVIQKMGFSGYFLIVWDFINYAKSVDIPVGPGRGSAAGSIVAYCLGITELNPLKYNLLFERFLNPDRNEMPDIDIDFCGVKRDDVIDYVRDKYGDDHVSQIMAFNTLKPKAAVKDVARALEMPFSEANVLTKNIEGKTVKNSINESKELKEFYETSERNKMILDNAMKLEGLVRSFGRHACGIVISKDPMTSYVPLYKDAKDGGICSQYEKGDSEQAGLVKMDFLGLKNLTIIDNTIKLIKKVHNIDLEINKIPLDDEKTYKLLQEADTNGVFQLESSGMQSLLRKLKPTVFDDIIAVGALYRPGPLNSGMTDQFVQRKRNADLIEYPHEILKPVLKDTLGVIIYQEQVMLISRLMGGFSMSEADKLRKAMGKKKVDIVQKMRNKFLAGAKEKKIDPKLAEELYDAMAKFAEYGFNKSHAAAYGLVTYQTAYLKAHYRTEFLTALLSASSGEQKDIVRYINDAKIKNINVLPPSINNSGFDFTIENGEIRFGFRAIKGIGDKVIERILNIRKEHGNFQNLKEFLENSDSNVISKGVLEALIKSGAMDCLHGNRAQLYAAIEVMIESAKKFQADKLSGQANLFAFGADSEKEEDNMLIDMPNITDWLDNQKLLNEKESLGVYVTGHPLAKYEKEIRDYSSCSIIDLPERVKESGQRITLVGIIEDPVKAYSNKSGKPYARGILEDMDASIPVLLFSNKKKLERFEDLFFSKSLLMVTGSVQIEEETSATMFIDEILPLSVARRKSISTLHINVDPIGTDDLIISNLKMIIEKNKGDIPVYFHVKENEKEKIVKAHNNFCIEPNDDLIKELTSLVGKDAFRYTFKMTC